MNRRRRSRRSRKKGWRAWVLPLVAIMVAAGGAWLLIARTADPGTAQMAVAGALAPAVSPHPAERTAALPPLNLPADDAPHGTRMEWWYYNGILDAKDGQRYAFHAAVFVADALIRHTVMHVALTDLRTGRRFASQSRTGGVPGKGGANGFEFRQDGWQVRGSGAGHAVRAEFDGVSISLALSDAHQPVAHRAADSATPGLLDFGKSGISYYYSRPRIAAQGELVVNGKPVQVTGDVWFDHQWGDFDVLTFGWNWFALHLADGSDVMLYELFDTEGRSILTAGTLSNGAKGTSVALRPGDIELTPLSRWTSPATKISYPVEWRVKLPAGEFNVKPYFSDGEFDASSTTANVYWEGAVKVTGSSEGEGFLELSGHERLRPGR